uniref:DNA damage-regulated autophagy modulator protein 2 n=1 Tax=Parastrongyloides trichosuri TaxID=131310 RepID=A0A0N4ZHH4_PARTI
MKKVWLLPILHVFFACLAFFSGYIIVVSKNLADPLLPYISDGGAFPPESAIFGEFLNIAAFLMAIVSYIRYQQLEVFYDSNKINNTFTKFNTALLFTGWLSSLGMSVVANFQEFSVPSMHAFGALLSFVGGLTYLGGQIILTAFKKPKLVPNWMFLLRTILTAISIIALIFHLITQFTFAFVKKNNDGSYPEWSGVTGIERYPTSSPFYLRHLITTIAEWVLVMSLEIHFLSFSYEMRDFEAKLIAVEYIGEVIDGGDRFDVRTNKIIRRRSEILNTGTISSLRVLDNFSFEK